MSFINEHVSTQSVLLTTFFDPRGSIMRVLEAGLRANIAEVKVKTDQQHRTIVFQIRRLTDAEALHLHMPIDNFRHAAELHEVFERDPAAMAKLILFLA